MTAIEATGIVKPFGRGEAQARVLRGTDCRAEAGELTFLLGPSGCGKTTLISVLATMLRPDEGKVRVFGTDLAGLRRRSLARFRSGAVGFIFQQFNLLPALDAAENAAVPLIIGGGRASGLPSPLIGWVWARASPSGRRSCRAGSSSAWPSPGR